MSVKKPRDPASPEEVRTKGFERQIGRMGYSSLKKERARAVKDENRARNEAAQAAKAERKRIQKRNEANAARRKRESGRANAQI